MYRLVILTKNSILTKAIFTTRDALSREVFMIIFDYDIKTMSIFDLYVRVP